MIQQVQLEHGNTVLVGNVDWPKKLRRGWTLRLKGDDRLWTVFDAWLYPDTMEPKVDWKVGGLR
jgi:hypothetical protein